MVLTGKACGPAGVPALAPPPQPASRQANTIRTVVSIANFFIIINLLMLPDFRVAHDWINAAPAPIQFRRITDSKVLECLGRLSFCAISVQILAISAILAIESSG